MGFNKEILQYDIKKNLKPMLMAAIALLLADLLIGKICPIRTVFGVPCPGCGLTRAFKLALTGHFFQATIIHPFWIGLTILLVLYFFIRYFIINEKLSKKLMHILKACAIIIAIICIIYYIYRMIFWYPNREPMQYDSKNIINYVRILLSKL